MRKESKRLAKWKKIFLLLAALAALWYIADNSYKIWHMRQEISEAEQKRTELLDEQKKLEAEKEKWQDPKEIERKARENLGMVKEGEIPYVK